MIEKLWMMSVQSCSLILIVLLVRKALQKYPKIYSYGLWALVLLRLLCPVFMESRLSLQPDFRNSRILQTAVQLSEIQTENENDAIGQAGLSENNFSTMAQADAQKAEPQGAEPWEAEPQKAEPQESRKTSDEKHETVFAAAAGQIRSGGVSAVLKVIYLTGLCIAAGCFGFQYFYMKRKVSLAVREKGNVWLCEAVRSPFVMGIVRPRIYLPFAISGDEKRHILKHERVHIRHKDPLVRFLGILVCCLHWWNPLVWYAVYKMNQDMEMFCDEAAMSGVPFAERRAYSKTLLHFAMKQSGLSVALSFGETNTEMRVKNILKKKKKSIAACIAVILLAAVCIVVFFTVPQSSSEGNAGEDLNVSLKNPEAGNDETEPGNTENSDAGEEENTEAPTEANDYYEELIAAARECIIRNDGVEPADYDFSSVIYMKKDWDYEILGYLIADIDGNGTEELIFGENGTETDSGWNGIIYDIYTIADGELVHVLDGWERNRYYLCTNGMIANEGSNSAFNSSYAYFTFEGTELHLVEAVIFDGWRDEVNPWFYSTESWDDAENAEPISEEQATEIMEKYVYGHPAFTPFVENH